MDALDELYAAPPEEFTATRDRLAKELKAAGDAEAAAEVRARRRPTVVAWAINQAVRAQPQSLQDLLAAGAALRRAHGRLVAGTIDREALRTAAEDERAAVGTLAAATAEAAQAARRPLGPNGMDKVRETLHAAVLDETVRDALTHGRLEREASASGTGLGAAVVAGGRGGGGGGRARPAAPARRGPSASELRQAREAANEAALDAARTLHSAEREAELRARRLELADQAAAAARQAMETAEAELAAARAALEEGQRELRAAKAAAASAQARLDEAQNRAR